MLGGQKKAPRGSQRVTLWGKLYPVPVWSGNRGKKTGAGGTGKFQRGKKLGSPGTTKRKKKNCCNQSKPKQTKGAKNKVQKARPERGAPDDKAQNSGGGGAVRSDRVETTDEKTEKKHTKSKNKKNHTPPLTNGTYTKNTKTPSPVSTQKKKKRGVKEGGGTTKARVSRPTAISGRRHVGTFPPRGEPQPERNWGTEQVKKERECTPLENKRPVEKQSQPAPSRIMGQVQGKKDGCRKEETKANCSAPTAPETPVNTSRTERAEGNTKQEDGRKKQIGLCPRRTR